MNQAALLSRILTCAWFAAVTGLNLIQVRIGMAAINPDELDQVKAAETARVNVVAAVFDAVPTICGQSVSAGGGSGVIIDRDGFALTNFHVVKEAGHAGKAGLADGQIYPWELFGVDPGGDLALVCLRGKNRFPVAPLGDSRTVRVGQWVFALGNPFLVGEDFSPTLTKGIISGIERFQPGASERVLVYGNCLQVDASINPGNSGGPLFDMQGTVIGINGRGSFEERGRVNVGLGYAISIEQAKNFLPELLAGKTCEHGTLEAVFRDDAKKVVCDDVAAESAIARLGLRKGDHLLAFEGVPIRTANQFLNLISTLPGNWPATVYFRGAAGEKTVTVRLRPLVYQEKQLPGGKPSIAPKRPQEKERPANKDSERPQGMVRPKGDSKGPVKPSSPSPNRQSCDWILRRWIEWLGGRDAVKKAPAIRTIETMSAGEKSLGRRNVLRAPDGRFRVEVLEGYTGALAGSAWGFDGKHLWRQSPDGTISELSDAESAKDFDVAASRAVAALRAEKPLEQFAAVQLEGADKAQGQRAFRLRIDDRAGNKLLFWFSVLDDRNQLQVRLLKMAAANNEPDGQVAWTFADDRLVAGLHMPGSGSRVRGLEEKPELQFRVTSTESVEDLPADAFRPKEKRTEGAK